MRSARSRAAASVRSWPTSTCTTCSTCGSSDGGRSRRTATSSSCVLPTTSSSDSSIARRPSGSSPSCASGSRGSALELHPDKTRLIEFGPYADRNRRARGDGKPETFNFLGFTHSCAKTRKGRFTVLRQTMRTRWQAKLKAVKAELRRRLHRPIPEQGALSAGGRPGPRPVLRRAHERPGARRLPSWPSAGCGGGSCAAAAVGTVPWHRMKRYIDRWLPPARICHPYPLVRFGVVTQGRSRMR